MPVAAKATTGPVDISHMLGGVHNIRRFTTIPESIEAIQFLDWNTATDIFSFADGFMFVGRGYEHKLRRPDEWTTEGELSPDAWEFLVFKVDSGEFRIDLGNWVVKKPSGSIVVYTDEQIRTHFTEDMF